MAGANPKLNKDFIACYFKDTSYAWLEFNDCFTGRGYLAKLNFQKEAGRSKYTSALTRFDPKFMIADGLICYADYYAVYAEDILTGKTERLKLSDKELKINWNQLHETIDSVNITRDRMYVELITNGERKPLEKKISM